MTRRRRRRGGRMAAAKQVTEQDVMGEKLFRLSKVAHQADVSIKSMQRYASQGLIVVLKVGPHGAPRMRASEVERFLGMMKKESE
jgi:phage gp46-like protein